MQIPWDSQINFASALLLHSCLTIIAKELLNLLEITRRLLLRGFLKLKTNSKNKNQPDAIRRSKLCVQSSVVLDVYTSIFSIDPEGEQAELYYTNTGLILLTASLATSVAMNLSLSDMVLNTIVASTYGLCFVSSMLVGKKQYTLPIMALRRAGRFIWSDTPLVNFFTLIYIATVLKGSSVLHLRDYVTFRCVAVLELIFMKAKLAASSPSKQESLMRRLIASEFVILPNRDTNPPTPPMLTKRYDITAFQTAQRMSVMLFKTTIGYCQGCLRGRLGPCRIPLPQVGHSIDDSANHVGLRFCRPTAHTLLIVDNFASHNHAKADLWHRFIAHAHGFLLRRLGKVRVVYLVAEPLEDDPKASNQVLHFHSNVNLVTGVTRTWLQRFPDAEPEGECIVG